jgi:copper chaperone CopZ
MQSKSFHLYEVEDENEVQEVMSELSSIDGVRSVQGDHETKIFAVTWSEPATWDDIRLALSAMHYTPEYR